MSFLIGDCGDCCCDEIAEPPVCPENFHRSLEETIADDYLDAIVQIWRAESGDWEPESQEFVQQNCTATASLSAVDFTYSTDEPESLNATIEVTPTDTSFNGLMILWGPVGSAFDPWAHTDHVAFGELHQSLVYRHGDADSDFFRQEMGANRYLPLLLAGQVIEYTNDDGDPVRLYRLWPFTFSGNQNHCWQSHTPETRWRLVADDGIWQYADREQLRDAGLDPAPISKRRVFRVGFVYGISSTWNFDGLPNSRPVSNTYSGNVYLDNFCMSARYPLHCLAAFAHTNTLTAQFGEPHIGLSNIEPSNLRGVRVPLTLIPITEAPGIPFADQLREVKLAGYAYYGATPDAFQAAGISITVQIYYLPCQLLVIVFSGTASGPSPFVSPFVSGFPCEEAYVHIRHQEPAPQDIGNENTNDLGGYHPPSFSGMERRDWLGILGVQYYGSACLDTPLGEFDHCYSLDPIAIGYVRRVTDAYNPTVFPPYTFKTCQEEPCVENSLLEGRSCEFTKMVDAGFVFRLEGSSIIEFIPFAGHFLVDITE